MIGEIRDLETAQIAVQASLTGHLVLATLHTNDAASAVTRLADMGVEPYLLASSLLGVLAQRLVRTLCPHCRTRAPPSAGEARLLAELGLPRDQPSGTRRRLRAVQPVPASRPHRHLRAVASSTTTLRRLIHDRRRRACAARRRDCAPACSALRARRRALARGRHARRSPS